MSICDALREYRRLIKAAIALTRLPSARLKFHSSISPRKIRVAYALFNKRHARFPMIKNKTMGVALIDLRKFKCPAEYLATVKKKDYAAHRARQARNTGCTVRRIDRNDFLDAIYEINTSSEKRQGRPMDAEYQRRPGVFDERAPMQSYGVFSEADTLMGYCSFGVYGNFAATDKLLGYRNKDGAMYLLLLEIICRLIGQKQIEFFMYDTFLGAQPGLQDFKRRIGFRPYRVSYTIT